MKEGYYAEKEKGKRLLMQGKRGTKVPLFFHAC